MDEPNGCGNRLTKQDNDHVCIRCIHENENHRSKRARKILDRNPSDDEGASHRSAGAYGKHEVLEGDPIEGIVIAKFPNVKAAKDWYYSEAYQSVAKHRKHGAIYHGLIVEGVS